MNWKIARMVSADDDLLAMLPSPKYVDDLLLARCAEDHDTLLPWNIHLTNLATESGC